MSFLQIIVRNDLYIIPKSGFYAQQYKKKDILYSIISLYERNV